MLLILTSASSASVISSSVLFLSRIRLEAGRTPRGVRLLVAGGVPSGEERGDALSVTIPVVRDHEVVAVDF